MGFTHSADGGGVLYVGGKNLGEVRIRYPIEPDPFSPFPQGFMTGTQDQLLKAYNAPSVVLYNEVLKSLCIVVVRISLDREAEFIVIGSEGRPAGEPPEHPRQRHEIR